MLLDNNRVEIRGYIKEDPVFSHECKGEKFFKANVYTERLSGTLDSIPVMIPEITLKMISKNIDMTIIGQFRSYNQKENGRSKLILYLLVQDIIEDKDEDSNRIFLDGYVCKQPNYRKTPLGREITDIVLAVNRSYGKSDYIPCICWGRNARYAKDFKVGCHIQVDDRIQSRKYYKELGDQKVEQIAYEVSVNSIM